jgi:acyl dehydratase
VAGAFVFSLGLGLAATNCLNSFSYGYDRLRFIKPVFIGDTIYTIRENLSKEVHNLTMGKLKVSYSVYKGEGELVLYAEHLLTALYRDPAPFAEQARARMAAKDKSRT